MKASQKLNQQQLAAEVGVLRRIHHPNIVQFLGACTRKNPVTIVSEVMEGGSLADALHARPQPPLRRALEIALDCARGLNYLHLANPHAIIHRDLKPSNILLASCRSATAKHKVNTATTAVVLSTRHEISASLIAVSSQLAARRDLHGLAHLAYCKTPGLHIKWRSPC